VKFSAATNRVERPNASSRRTDCRIACAAGQKKNTTVTASCGNSRSTGKSQPEKTTRRSIRQRPPLHLLNVFLELAQDGVAARDRIVERGFGLALPGEDAFEIFGDDVADLHQIAEPQAS